MFVLWSDPVDSADLGVSSVLMSSWVLWGRFSVIQSQLVLSKKQHGFTLPYMIGDKVVLQTRCVYWE